MTGEHVLVVAWLLVAHLIGDFVLQHESMVNDKFTPGRRGWRGLIGHGAGVGMALTPVPLVFGAPGALFLVIVVVGHVLIDRWKVRATRHAEAVALAASHRRHEPAAAGEAGLGPAWTPLPGALFLVDQLLHIGLTLAATPLLFAATPTPEYLALVDRLLRAVDPDTVHRGSMAAAVVIAIAIANVRAAALFVATLVNPRETVTGEPPREPAPPAPGVPRAWRIRVGPITAAVDPAIEPAAPLAATPSARQPDGHASPARIGATIGVLERVLIVIFVVTNSTAAIGFVVAAKTLARFKQLDDRNFAEYYLLGTLASVSVALVTGLLAAGALSTLP